MNTEALLFGRSFIKFYTKICEEICIKHNLTQLELDVLAFLQNHPNQNTAKDIVEIRMFTKSNVSQAVEQLAKRGFIVGETDEKDKRKIHLLLQPETDTILKDIREVRKRFSEVIIKGFSVEEQELLGYFLLRISQNINQGLAKEME